jgi:hypothetical protein
MYSRVLKILSPNLFKPTQRIAQQIKRAFSKKVEVKGIYTKPSIYSGGNFEELVKQSSIFVDKSLFIKEIIESEDKVTLITMPRRWGKSLNLDMLKRFLSIEVDKQTASIISHKQTDNYKLFVGGEIDLGLASCKKKTLEQLKIAKHEDIMFDYQGQFPVIFVDLKDCKGSNVSEIEAKLKQKITELFINFGYLTNSNKIYSGEITVRDQYKKLLANIEQNFKTGIKDLSELIYAHHDQKAWILIDEYDAAVNEAYRKLDENEAQKVANLFRDILEPSLKGNDFLAKSVMTGVQYVIKSVMLSGLNNLTKYSIQNYKFSQYYGINQEEMDILLSHFNVKDDQKDKIKYWYNGYQERVTRTGEFVDKYNIWSVVQYLNKPENGFRAYWEESGSIDFIKKLLKKKGIIEKINSLVDGESIAINLNIDFSVEDFKTLKEIINLGGNKEINHYGLDILFSYLFITGYLTEDGHNKYKFPNEEIKYAIGRRVIEHYQTIYSLDPEKLHDLSDILQKLFDKNQSTDNTKEKIDFIKKSFISKFQPKFDALIKECKLVDYKDSTDGIFANEDSIHSILNYIGMQVRNVLFGSEIYTKKLLSDNKGRVDIIVKNKETGIIIEVKYNGKASEALAQAKTYENLISDQQDKIFIGLDISTSREVSLAGEIHIDEKVYSIHDSEIE